MGPRRPWQVVLTIVLALCLGPSVASDTTKPGTPAATTDHFPTYDSIRGNVDFWTRVFGELSLGQVAVHDMDYPTVVYDVVDLPGPIEERYTEEQRDFIDDLNEQWRDWLESIEDRVARKEELTKEEKQVALLLTTHAGTGAIVGAHERIRTQRGLRERFRRGFEIGQRYDAMIRQIFSDAGLPADLAYLPHVESSFQASARSSAGAVGVWQFTRGTGRLFMTVNSTIDERLDPIAAAHGAAAYLRKAYDELGDWPIALTSYNHGVAGMRRAVNMLGADYEKIFNEYDGRTFGFASRNFYAEFLAARSIARDPQRFFPEGLTPEPPLDLDRMALESRTTAATLARAFGLQVDELAQINPAWSRRVVESGRALPRGLHVWLPRGTLERAARQDSAPDYSLPPALGQNGIHVVQPGDTLSTIARANGIELHHLRELNDMGPREHVIHVGQKLRVLDGQSETIHVVRRGQTLSAIAQAYGMSVGKLRAMNGIAAGSSLIRTGQRLRVIDPGGAAVHVVERGDTLMHIALRHGIRVADLLLHNQLTMSSVIYPGQVLRIPR